MRILDSKTGAKIRAWLWIASAVVSFALETLGDLEKTGWVLTPALIVSLLGKTPIGNRE